MAWKKLVLEENVIIKAFMNAKGDLIGASADDTPVILGVGVDGKVLTAASGEVTGLAWSDAGTGDLKADGTVPMTAALDFAKHGATAACLDVQASAPDTPGVAQVYFNSDTDDAWLNVE